ncbi:MAG TPA: MBL fold metallo-hydrolase [Candidatus Lumbricidophila sp.]|nr:MBL fold metallo-hydrolase [Candidatus Lumbricidophila sp.]
MRLTKYDHAALTLEEGGERLVIDPGKFTEPFEVADTVAVVVTHLHDDHWTPEHLDRIRAANPDVRLFGPAGVATAASAYPFEVVAPGDSITVGAFTLRFFGGEHAVIHRSVPVIDNVGVLVNDRVYYPGDSYALPDAPGVPLLVAPAGAPWLKIGDAIDFVLAAAPMRTIPTHWATLSDAGRQMAYGRLQWATEQGGGEFIALAAGDSLEL